MYYATEFKNRVGDLRTNRIEGYQSYDEFVKRFLYQIFSKIEQIDTQYREIGRRIDRWTFLSEANSSFEHHRLIEDSTKQTKQVADNIESLQRTIAHLLENAEKFAAIFFVYYLGSILKAPLTDTFVVPQRLRNLTGISFDYNFLWATIALLVTINMFGNRGYACKNAYKFAKRLGELILRGSLNIVFSRIDRALPPRSRFKGKLSLIERDKFFGPEMGGSAGQNNRTSQDSTID
jgi:hypothetical protein